MTNPAKLKVFGAHFSAFNQDDCIFVPHTSNGVNSASGACAGPCSTMTSPQRLLQTYDEESLLSLLHNVESKRIPILYNTENKTVYLNANQQAVDLELGRISSLASDDNVKKIEELLDPKCAITIFIKGSSVSPQCGFSRKVVAALQNAKLPFESFNILSDPELREALKQYAVWPTFPQIYKFGRFWGGGDQLLAFLEENPTATSLA